jgi:hypothetical protein
MTDTKVIEQVKTEVPVILEKAMGYATVQNAETEIEAVKFLGRIKDNIKIVDNQYTFLTAPLKKHIKAIKEEFDKITDPLEQAQNIVKESIRSWRESDTFKALEAERISLENQARIAVDGNDLDALQSLSIAHGDISALAPKTVRTEEANMHMRSSWKFEIEDETLIPKEYLMPDEKKIRMAIKEGKTIAGVKSWKEHNPVIVG